MKKIAVTAAAALFATFGVGSASASVVISSSVVGSAASYAAPSTATKVIDFNSGNVVTEALSKGLTAVTTGTAQAFTGYVFGFNGNDFYQPEPTDSTRYFGVGRNSSLIIGSATAIGSVSAFLGSLDNYNLVTFYAQDGSVIDSFTGQQIYGAPLAFPGGAGTETNRRVTFSATNGTEIYKVGFSNINGLGSFEFDNVGLTAAVPEPATWAMMLIGVGAIGAAARRRRSVAAPTYA